MQPGGGLRKGVIERLPQPRLDPRFAVQRDGPVEVVAKQPEVIEAKRVVGMFVSEQRRLDEGNLFADQLQPQFGRSVDQKVPLTALHQHSGSRAMIAGVFGETDRTAAAHHRHPRAGTGAEQNDLGAGSRGGIRHTRQLRV